MLIQFDPAKDAINRVKHGIGLAEAARIDWDDAVIWLDNRFDYGEERMVGWGMIGEKLFYVVFVEHEDITRVISLRPAKKHEHEQYVRFAAKR